MANILLDNHISIDDLQQIIKNGFPNYTIERKGSALIIDTGFQGKYSAFLSGKMLAVNPRVPFIVGLLLVMTIIGIILIAVAAANNPTAKEIINYVKSESGNQSLNTINTSTIPSTCPQCKNPNTKKTRMCEWCGSQII